MKPRKILLLLGILGLSSSPAFAVNYTSTSYTLKNAQILSAYGEANSLNYTFQDVRIGDLFSIKAHSANYTLTACNKKGQNAPPNPPALNPPATPTNTAQQTLSGSKDANTAIYINGYIVVPLNNQTSWSGNWDLSEGDNYLTITARNKQGVESSAITTNIFLDSTSPSTPLVTDDGEYTTAAVQLYAMWSAQDAQTRIIEYQYAIGTQSGGADIVGWTSCGTETEITRAGLTLTQGVTYYISVQAKNAAGSWSETGTSDGITVNQHTPGISAITPVDGSGFYPDELTDISIQAADDDTDTLEYLFSLDGEVIHAWQSSSSLSWPVAGLNEGIHTITCTVSDKFGGKATQDTSIYVFRQPPQPSEP